MEEVLREDAFSGGRNGRRSGTGERDVGLGKKDYQGFGQSVAREDLR